jgi:hypothetical protein
MHRLQGHHPIQASGAIFQVLMGAATIENRRDLTKQLSETGRGDVGRGLNGRR